MHHARLIIAATLVATTASTQALARDDSGINALYGRLSVAIEKADANSAASIYGHDSVYLGAGGPPIFGNEAIAKAFDSSWKSFAASGAKPTVQFRLLQRIWHGKDSATDVGFSRYTLTQSDATKPPIEFFSKFSTLAQRQKDGRWIFRVDIDNPQSPKTGKSEFEALKPVEGLKFDQ